MDRLPGSLATLPTYRAAAAAAAGGASALSAKNKTDKVIAQIPEHAWFQAVVVEADGYLPEVFTRMLYGWSRRWADANDESKEKANQLYSVWLDGFAIYCARQRGRCINERAARCVEESNFRGGAARAHLLPPLMEQIELHSVPGGFPLGGDGDGDHEHGQRGGDGAEMDGNPLNRASEG